MKTFLILLVGMAVGYFLAKRGDLGFKNNDVSEAKELKEERKRKILAMFDSKESITNNDVEQALGTSDRSATRYLDELEKEGKVEQIGTTGRSVTYRLRS